MNKQHSLKRIAYLVVSVWGASSVLMPSAAVAAGSTLIASGFTAAALMSPSMTPYRGTTQDLDALLVGNALASKTTLTNNQSDLQAISIPYKVNITQTSSAKQISADTLNLQSLATLMGLSDYTAITTQATQDYAVYTPSSSSTSALLWGTAADQQSATTDSGLSLNGNTLTVSKGALSEFNVQSILNPQNYSSSNAQKYLALVAGSSAPPGSMLLSSDFNGNTQNYLNYNLLVAREAAVQSAAVDALQQFAEANVPLTNTPASSLGSHFVNTGLIPTENTLTAYMATRRLDPSNNWYYRTQQASALELQREGLYMQAEALYELEKIRQQSQKNNLLLAMMLIEQSRSNIGAVNMQYKMIAAQSSGSTSSSSTTTTSTTATMDDSTTTTST